MSTRVHVATASAVGPSHVARGRGNEDAVAWRTDEDGVTVVAVADGHSDPRCVRADRGARLAVLAAVQVAAASQAEPGDLVSGIADRWRALVADDEHADPLTGASAGGALLAYGTTLLVARIDPVRTVLLQVGDGDVVVADERGARRAMLGDGLEGANATHSLASAAVARVARTSVVALEAPSIVLLSTDGLDNAYPAHDSLLHAARELLEEARAHGAAAVDARLPAWMRDAAVASGDDATVAVAVVTGAGRHRAAAEGSAL